MLSASQRGSGKLPEPLEAHEIEPGHHFSRKAHPKNFAPELRLALFSSDNGFDEDHLVKLRSYPSGSIHGSSAAGHNASVFGTLTASALSMIPEEQRLPQTSTVGSGDLPSVAAATGLLGPSTLVGGGVKMIVDPAAAQSVSANSQMIVDPAAAQSVSPRNSQENKMMNVKSCLPDSAGNFMPSDAAVSQYANLISVRHLHALQFPKFCGDSVRCVACGVDVGRVRAFWGPECVVLEMSRTTRPCRSVVYSKSVICSILQTESIVRRNFPRQKYNLHVLVMIQFFIFEVLPFAATANEEHPHLLSEQHARALKEFDPNGFESMEYELTYLTKACLRLVAGCSRAGNSF